MAIHKIKFFAGRGSRYLAEKIVASYGTTLGNSEVQQFSDGEFQPCFNESIRGCTVFIIQSTFPPSDNLMELLMMIDAARRASAYQVVAVVTQPDKPVGRHQDRLQPPAVKVYAQEHNIPVLQPVKMKDPEFVEALRAYEADLQVVVAFRLLPEIIWDMPRFGTFNVHAALCLLYTSPSPRD